MLSISPTLGTSGSSDSIIVSSTTLSKKFVGGSCCVSPMTIAWSERMSAPRASSGRTLDPAREQLVRPFRHIKEDDAAPKVRNRYSTTKLVKITMAL